MGSGTTLLRLMLDSHERIAIPHETGFMRAYKAQKFIPFKWTGRGWAKRLGWSDEELDRELSAFYTRIFMRYAELNGKQRWGEKTPMHTWHVTAMARVFPDAVFVGIVRHPGACVASNVSRFRQPPAKAMRHWDRYNREIARQAASYADRFVVLRYEELVLAPDALMRELLSWLSEPWSDKVMQHHVVQSERDHKRIEGKTRAGDAIDASRITKWTRQLDEPTQRMLRRRLGRLAEFWGYSMREPSALQPLKERDGLLVSGAEIGSRIDQFEDLDLPTRPRVAYAEHYYHPRHLRLVANKTGTPASWERARAAASKQTEGRPRTATRALARRLPPRARKAVLRARRTLREWRANARA